MIEESNHWSVFSALTITRRWVNSLFVRLKTCARVTATLDENRIAEFELQNPPCFLFTCKDQKTSVQRIKRQVAISAAQMIMIIYSALELFLFEEQPPSQLLEPDLLCLRDKHKRCLSRGSKISWNTEVDPTTLSFLRFSKLR